MNTADRFLRFAAECEVMAKISRSSENRSVWNRLAQRWQRCAELFDNLYSDDRINSMKRYPRAMHSATRQQDGR